MTCNVPFSGDGGVDDDVEFRSPSIPSNKEANNIQQHTTINNSRHMQYTFDVRMVYENRLFIFVFICVKWEKKKKRTVVCDPLIQMRLLSVACRIRCSFFFFLTF